MRPGQFYAFDLVVNGVVAQDVPSALNVYDEVATIVAILQEDAAQ